MYYIKLTLRMYFIYDFTVICICKQAIRIAIESLVRNGGFSKFASTAKQVNFGVAEKNIKLVFSFVWYENTEWYFKVCLCWLYLLVPLGGE